MPAVAETECCIASCKSTKLTEILYKFPNPDSHTEKFNTWVKNAGLVGEFDSYIYHYRRICRKHFEEKYVSPSSRLNKSAIPTLELIVPVESMETQSAIGEIKPLSVEFTNIVKDVSMTDHDLEKELMFAGPSNESIEIDVPQLAATDDTEEKYETGITEKEAPYTGKSKGSKGDEKKEKLKCTECDRYTTTDPDRLIRHIRKIHRGENPFQCGMCEYSTYNKAVFEDHVRWHQGIKPFECKMCNYKSVSKNNLSKHEKIHKPQECRTCGQVTYTRKGYAWHMKTAHPESSWVYCKHCNTDFKTKKNLRYHQKTYVKSCEKCPAKLCSKALMIKHMADVHKDYFYKSEVSKRKPVYVWMCQVCKWEAKNEQKTLLHLIHHPNQEIDQDAVDVTPLLKWNILPMPVR